MENIFNRHKEKSYLLRETSVRERKIKLKLLHDTIIDHIGLLSDAVYKDIGKSSMETKWSELLPLLSEIRFTIKHLKTWMRIERVGRPLSLIGSSSSIVHEPKGTCLIISPWNYPLNLTLSPLVSAIAAGNSVIIKPSEYTPATSEAIANLISNIFDSDEIQVIQGGIETSQKLLKQAFDHIFFTGSPNVGKIIMKAASNHLSSVTLELGGKSPVIIDSTANIKKAATVIARSKMLNAGQTCIAPDYIFIHTKIREKFIKQLILEIERMYGSESGLKKHYTQIINKLHFDRLDSLYNDALNSGAKISYKGYQDKQTNLMGPIILTDLNEKSPILKEEIFGPIIPIIDFTDLQEVINHINKEHNPLTMYIFSKNKNNINTIKKRTSSGAITINEGLIHFGNPHLPFGGVNNSGIGKSHGYFGFQEFSNKKAVIRQWFPYSSIDLITPPYSKFKKILLNFSLKWL